MNNADLPAMPQSATSEGHSCNYYDYGGPGIPTGLTKREMMAMHMLQGILTGQDTDEMVVGDDKCFAEFAVQCADALLAELGRTK